MVGRVKKYKAKRDYRVGGGGAEGVDESDGEIN